MPVVGDRIPEIVRSSPSVRGRNCGKRGGHRGCLTAADQPAGMGIKFIKMDTESRAMVERIIEAAHKALAIDPQLAPAYHALGVGTFRHGLQRVAAHWNCKRIQDHRLLFLVNKRSSRNYRLAWSSLFEIEAAQGSRTTGEETFTDR